MTIAPASLVPGLTLGTTAAAIYTVPASTKAVIKRAVFVNADTASGLLTVTITRSGGSALTIIKAMPVAAGASYVSQELANFVLNTSDVVSAFATGSATVNAFVNGFVVT